MPGDLRQVLSLPVPAFRPSRTLAEALKILPPKRKMREKVPDRTSVNAKLADDVVEHMVWLANYEERVSADYVGRVADLWRRVLLPWIAEHDAELSARPVSPVVRERVVSRATDVVTALLRELAGDLASHLEFTATATWERAAASLADRVPDAVWDGLALAGRLPEGLWSFAGDGAKLLAEVIEPTSFFRPPSSARVAELASNAGQLADTWNSVGAAQAGLLRRGIVEGISAGEGTADIARRIKDTLVTTPGALPMGAPITRAGRLDARLLAITRTEVQRVGNDALADLYRSPEARTVVKGEQHISTLDDRTCLAGFVRIATPDGEKPISEIRVGDVVIGGSGVARRVLAVSPEVKDATLCAAWVGERFMMGTADHELWTLDGWAPFGAFHEGDHAYGRAIGLNGSREVIRINKIVLFNARVQVFDITVEKDASFFAEGVLVHNCDRCAMLDAKVWIGEDVANMPWLPIHPRCVRGMTRVWTPLLRAVTVAEYDGPMVEVDFADGGDLHATPNHLVLTPRGWARAGSLREGDNVLEMRDVSAMAAQLRMPGSEASAPTMLDVTDAAAGAEALAMRLPSAPEHFHGDGEHMRGSVRLFGTRAIVDGIMAEHDEDSDARRVLAAFGLLRRADGLLPERDKAAGDWENAFRSMASAADTIMLGAHDATHGRRESLLVAGQANSDHGTWRPDRVAARVEVFRQIVSGLRVDVKPRTIEAARTYHFAGKVYDLDADGTLYAANGVLVSNCRCVRGPVTRSWDELGFPDAVEIAPYERAAMDGAAAPTLTYPRWLAAQGDARKLDILGRGRFGLLRDAVGKATAGLSGDAATEAAFTATERFVAALARIEGPVVKSRTLPQVRAIMARQTAAQLRRAAGAPAARAAPRPRDEPVRFEDRLDETPKFKAVTGPCE